MKTKLTLGSLFSGIGGFELGFERTQKIKTIWQVERDQFCRRVLRSHWPAVHRFADVRKVGKRNLQPVDCITAGVPCQDVSVAGKRAGLAGKRTGLFYEFARILQEIRPRWFVMENVPGLLSSNGGRDFAEILRVLMVECGYGVSWRVLDSRYFGVAQRRRRVFLVGRFGKPCPAEILFDAASGERDFKARRKARANLAAPLTHGSGVTGNAPGRRREDDENIVYKRRGGFGWSASEGISPTLEATAGSHQGGSELTPIVAGTINTRHSPNGHGAAGPRVEDIPNLVAYALRNDPGGIGQGHNTTYVCGTDTEHQERSSVIEHAAAEVDGANQRDDNECAPLDADGVRNITRIPKGLYDSDWPLLPKGLDSARYRALGNAVTVNVIEFIARNIISASEIETPQIHLEIF